jgi:hypothetical protein
LEVKSKDDIFWGFLHQQTTDISLIPFLENTVLFLLWCFFTEKPRMKVANVKLDVNILFNTDFLLPVPS